MNELTQVQVPKKTITIHRGWFPETTTGYNELLLVSVTISGRITANISPIGLRFESIKMQKISNAVRKPIMTST